VTICGGVLTPRDDYTEPTCFVTVRGLTEEPWSGAFAASEDHFYPRSVFGDGLDMPTHLVHRYCQRVQGAYVRNGVCWDLARVWGWTG